MTIPRGTARDIRLTIRALKTARHHLSQARSGLKGQPDADALDILTNLAWEVENVRSLLSLKTGKRRQGKAA